MDNPGAAATGKKPFLFSRRDLRGLIIPLMIEQALAMTIGMFDTMMVSSVGEAAVSGISLVDTINVLILYLFSALATGGAVVAGQYIGARDKDNAANAGKQLILSSALLGLLMMALCLLFCHPLLSLFFGDVEAGVMGSAALYFTVVVFSYPCIAIFYAAAALFRGMGDSKNPMVYGFIMNGLNIALNAVFIFGLSLGVLGAALGTVLSRLIGVALILRKLRSPALTVSIRSYYPKELDFPMIRRILAIGIPNGLENGLFQLGRIMMTGLVATLGTASIAAHAVAGSLTGLEVIPGQAMGLAVITVVARCAGAKEEVQARIYTKTLVKLAYLFLILLNLIMLLLIRPVLGIYSLSPETFRMANIIMVIHGIGAMTVWPISFTLPNAFRAVSDVKYPMLISILSMFVFRVGCSFLLHYAFHLGVYSVWLSMVIDWTFRAICFAIHWRRGKWKRKAFAVPAIAEEVRAS